MELAKITSKGQITIPISIRRRLGVKDGDKVMFIEKGSQILITNATMNALDEVQKSFSGVAEEIGIKDEQDVVNMVKEIRKERSERYKICE